MLNVIARQTTQIVNELVRTSVFVLTSTHVWFVFSPSLSVYTYMYVHGGVVLGISIVMTCMHGLKQLFC